MKKLLFPTLLLAPLLAFAQQETTTYRVDSVGRAWVLTITIRYDRPDSTYQENSQTARFKNRAAARQYVRGLFAERITTDSTAVESLKRKIALAKSSRAGLLDDLKRTPTAPKEAVQPAAEMPVATPKKKSKKQ